MAPNENDKRLARVKTTDSLVEGPNQAESGLEIGLWHYLTFKLGARNRFAPISTHY